jgi:hypothetical protein
MNYEVFDMELYLLNKDDACNFEVLDYILHQGNLKATKVDLMETFKLSTYKMDKAINSLNADLMEIATSDVVVEIK